MASSNKIITVLGGTGYVGKACVKKLLAYDSLCRVNLISRSGKIDLDKRFDKTEIERINVVKADALNPTTFKNELLESDSIIHSIGALLTLKKPESEHSYDSKNRKTAVYAGELIEKEYNGDKKKNFIYISAQRGLPFPSSFLFGGYIQTKIQAENQLLQLSKLNTYILRPGLITDPIERSWAIPLGYGASFINCAEKTVQKITGVNIGDSLQLPSIPTKLEKLSSIAAKCALGLSDENKKLYTAEDLDKRI